MANTRNTPSEPAGSLETDFSFDNIDDSAFDKLLKEQAELQTAFNHSQSTNTAQASPVNQTPTQQPRLFKSTPVVTEQRISVSGSIADDAKKMLTLLHDKAQLMAGEADCEQYGWGAAEEDDRLYFKVHNVKISLAESNLPEERFHAAFELIETVMLRYPSLAYDKHAGKDDRLDITCAHGKAHFQVHARYARNYLLQNRIDYKYLLAPISKVPFEAAYKAVDDVMKLVFSSWISDVINTGRLVRSFSNQTEAIKISAALHDIEKSCKEIDKDFSFNKELRDNASILIISRDALEKADGLLLKDNSARFQAKLRR